MRKTAPLGFIMLAAFAMIKARARGRPTLRLPSIWHFVKVPGSPDLITADEILSMSEDDQMEVEMFIRTGRTPGAIYLDTTTPEPDIITTHRVRGILKKVGESNEPWDEAVVTFVTYIIEEDTGEHVERAYWPIAYTNEIPSMAPEIFRVGTPEPS